MKKVSKIIPEKFFNIVMENSQNLSNVQIQWAFQLARDAYAQGRYDEAEASAARAKIIMDELGI